MSVIGRLRRELLAGAGFKDDTSVRSVSSLRFLTMGL
jgi:hypothetical protein